MLETGMILGFLKELVFLLVTAGVFLFLGLVRGTQQLINLILGLYFGLLITLEFPYTETIIGSASDAGTQSILSIVMFIAFSIAGTLFFSRLLPTDDFERGFSDGKRKLLYALAATALVMTFSYHVLPVTDLITPGSPITYIFGSKQSFFWWLIAPFVLIYWLRN